MYDFSGKRALVTGGASGIGKGIALKLAKYGAQVWIIGRNKEQLTSLENEYKNIQAICLDITKFEEAKEAVQSLSPIHLLVNNAGTGSCASVLDATLTDFDTMFDLNVKAVMNITQVVAKNLVKLKEKGQIVNISSQAGQRALPDHLVYCSTKASLDMLTKVFALELAPHNIRVNAVSPTVVMTAMGKKGWSDPAKANWMLSRIPQGRFADVEEVANAVMFLLSDQSEMINGHCLPVDGGFLAN